MCLGDINMQSGVNMRSQLRQLCCVMDNMRISLRLVCYDRSQTLQRTAGGVVSTEGANSACSSRYDSQCCVEQLCTVSNRVKLLCKPFPVLVA